MSGLRRPVRRTIQPLYEGGEDQIRGFASGALSPIAYIPDTALTPVLNANGTPMIYGGVPVMATLLMYRPVAIGGDTALVANFEYRIPLFRPLTLVLFTDAGLNRVSLASQVRIDQGVATHLSAEFGGATVGDRLLVTPASQKIRMSSGAELQARVPGLGAPVRLYWAYNELRCANPGVTLAEMPACGLMIPPFVTVGFVNYPTYANAQSMLGPNTTHDPRSMLGVAIGWTF